MVLENPSIWPVADWWYETARVPAIGVEAFTDLLAMCEKCLSILARYQLLMPTNIILSSTWEHYNELGKHSGTIDKDKINIEFPDDGSKTLTDLVLPCVLRNQLEKGFTCPDSFEVRGKGVILDGFGSKVTVPDVVSVESEFFGGAVVDVLTNNDAWLPYSLRAEPQDGVYRNNAPRLEGALKEIEVALGVKGYAEDHSDYCRINGYTLDNFRDPEDMPMAVGLSGRILES
jgi:hypothetical protein